MIDFSDPINNFREVQASGVTFQLDSEITRLPLSRVNIIRLAFMNIENLVLNEVSVMCKNLTDSCFKIFGKQITELTFKNILINSKLILDQGGSNEYSILLL